ncbi:MAG: YciI family protein [Polyangiales bacterium]
MSEQIVVCVYPGASLASIAPLCAMLRAIDSASSLELCITAPTRGAVRTDEGLTLQPDAMFAEVDLGAVAAIIVASAATGAAKGASIDSVIDDLSLLSLLDRAATTGVTVGSIGDGTLLLGRSGAIRGVSVTHAFDGESHAELSRSSLRGTVLVDDDVAIDAPSEGEPGSIIVTARPWAAIEFAKKLVAIITDADRESIARSARALRGSCDRGFGDPYERWVITLTAVADRPASREDIEAHVAHLRALERRGALELSGPLAEARSGMVIVRASSREEAERIAREDPFVQRGVRSFELQRWLLSREDNNHML